jgi:hypothetical protein
MSRHCFSNIVKNEAALVDKYDLYNGDTDIVEPRDSEGCGLLEWLEDGVVGWDEPMQTYFIQCKEVGEGLVWWFGTSFREIQKFDDLCAIINRVFKNSVDFEFIDVIDRQS